MGSHKLIVFLKAPRPGLVKTRLAATVGEKIACEIYRELVKTVLDNVAVFPEVELRFAPDESAAEIKPWLRPGWTMTPQGPGDLGQRLHAAFSDAFDRCHQSVTAIGSDCPEFTASDIESAQAALESADVVLGPAADGGYWLIAMKKLQPALFEGIAWSTPAVLTQTLDRAKGRGLKVSLLRTLADVDTEEDWRRFLAGHSCLSGVNPQPGPTPAP